MKIIKPGREQSGVETDFGDGVHIPFSAPDKEAWERARDAGLD